MLKAGLKTQKLSRDIKKDYVKLMHGKKLHCPLISASNVELYMKFLKCPSVRYS
jgi:hypothetical protein